MSDEERMPILPPESLGEVEGWPFQAPGSLPSRVVPQSAELRLTLHLPSDAKPGETLFSCMPPGTALMLPNLQGMGFVVPEAAAGGVVIVRVPIPIETSPAPASSPQSLPAGAAAGCVAMGGREARHGIARRAFQVSLTAAP